VSRPSPTSDPFETSESLLLASINDDHAYSSLSFFMISIPESLPSGSLVSLSSGNPASVSGLQAQGSPFDKTRVFADDLQPAQSSPSMTGRIKPLQ